MKRLVFIAMCLAAPVCAQDDKPWAEVTPELTILDAMPRGLQTPEQLQVLRDTGRALFKAGFTRAEGAGRPMATQAIIPTKPRRALGTDFTRTSGPDANACSSCHIEPFVGGAGGFVANVFVSEGFANHDFDTTDPEFSNERGTNHLFGAGLVELLAREMTADLTALRSDAIKQARTDGAPVRIALRSKDVSFGHITAQPDGIVDLSEIEGVDMDLVIRPFSQKGVFTSLRQFTINALNHHHGMQPTERWGARWTGQADFDEDGFDNEVSPAAVSALVAWQAALPPPMIEFPDDPVWQEYASKGADVFTDLGCAECHRTHLPLRSLRFVDPAPFDAAGTLNDGQVENPAIYDLEPLLWARVLPRNDKGEVMVPLFGDLKRHKMTDADVAKLGNELLSQRFVGRDSFMTAELWGIGSTAPYGHRNDLTTLDAMITAHGGQGRAARDAYLAANDQMKEALIAYLRTFKILDEE